MALRNNLSWLFYLHVRTNSLAGVTQWIEHHLQTTGSPVRHPVWVRAWIVGQVPSGGVFERQTHIDVSLPLSFPSPLYKNK